MKSPQRALYIVFMCSPLLIVIGAAFCDPGEILRFPPHGVSLTWFGWSCRTGVPRCGDQQPDRRRAGDRAVGGASPTYGLCAVRQRCRYRETILGLLLAAGDP